jgi:hypothetical protein
MPDNGFPPLPAPTVALVESTSNGMISTAWYGYLLGLEQRIAQVPSGNVETLRVALNEVRADADIGLPAVPPFA